MEKGGAGGKPRLDNGAEGRGGGGRTGGVTAAGERRIRGGPRMRMSICDDDNDQDDSDGGDGDGDGGR